MYPLLIGVFTLGLVCEPLFARLFTILQSTYRDYRFRRQMFKQDAFVKSLEANGWLLLPPDAQATIPYDRNRGRVSQRGRSREGDTMTQHSDGASPWNATLNGDNDD